MPERPESSEPRAPARMIDVGDKEPTVRTAAATGRLRLQPEVLRLLRERKLEKGDALEVARIAGILAAKNTPVILPLCHPLRLSGIAVDFEFEGDRDVRIRATVRATDRTGVEMEALTAVSVAGLAIYDVCKRHDPRMELGEVRLEEKTGGRTGDYHRKPRVEPPCASG